MNLTAYDFFGDLTWTGGTDKERCERLHAFEELGLEPEEIKVTHGKWIEEKYSFPACSVCDEPIVTAAPTNYCPNCGAKMDGGIADDN